MNLAENKNKGNSTVKPKPKSNEEKNKKSNALKDSKKINLDPKNAQKTFDDKEVQKGKGKENVDAMSDFDVEEGISSWISFSYVNYDFMFLIMIITCSGLWEQAFSRKKNRKNQNTIPEGKFQVSTSTFHEVKLDSNVNLFFGSSREKEWQKIIR